MKFKPLVLSNGQLKSRGRIKKASPDPVEEAIANSEGIKELEKEILTTHRLPSMMELAQLAAAIATPKDLKGNKTRDLVERALALWQQTGHSLRKRMEEDIELERQFICFEHSPQPSELEQAVGNHENFPMEFERALKLIVGNKVRRADRYKTFRDFTRDTFRQYAKNDEALEKLVADKFASLQAKGFDAGPFERAALLFQGWKATRASEKASKAAQMRWSKK